jgi:hypothetical protein
MTVTLGGISLSNSLILGGLEKAPGVAYSARRTLGGRMVVQVGATLSSGRELSLSAENHFTLAQVGAIKALESAGLPVTLVHHRGTFNVLVVGVDVEPAIPYSDPDTADWYSGAINLLEV